MDHEEVRSLLVDLMDHLSIKNQATFVVQRPERMQNSIFGYSGSGPLYYEASKIEAAIVDAGGSLS